MPEAGLVQGLVCVKRALRWCRQQKTGKALFLGIFQLSRVGTG